MNSIKVYCKMNTISINSGNNKIFEPHRLLFKLSDKLNLKRSNSYVNKIKSTIFEVKRCYCLGILTPETMEVFGSTRNKITKNKNNENVSHLEIPEVVLINFNVIKNEYQQSSNCLVCLV